MTRPGVPFLPGYPRLQEALHPLLLPPGDAGWNLSELADLCPADQPRREAAVLVGLVPRPGGSRALLTVRTNALRLHAGQVSFPGGRIEAGDRDIAAAAVRECMEEVGLQATDIQPLGYLDPLVTVTGFRVTPVVALLDPAYVACPDPGEVERVFEVPLAFLLEPGNLAMREMPYRGRLRLVAEYVEHGEDPQPIWGATASILLNLRERLSQLA